ncbi:MAG: ABC transporter substrate-binding protein, partial [Mariprofundales bacterium]|nr:ABC transporter substrate-binding protein [Mariprofundales bacterium]
PLLWRFVLRSGVRFHNGSSLTAQDVVATINSVLDRAVASPLRASFSAIDGVMAIGSSVVEIRLKRVDASLLTRLVIGIIPASQAAQPQQTRRAVGCGDYRLQSWRGDRIVLTAVASRHPDIVLIRVKDPVTRALKLARGEIDLMQNDFPLYLLTWLRKQPHLQVATAPSTTFSYIGINLHDPLLKQLQVRQALALALDRKRLKRALFNGAPVLASTLLPAEHWATTKLPLTPYDPERAAALLDGAGYPADEDGVRFYLSYRTSTDPQRVRLATAIAAEWHKIGVEVTVQSLEWGGFYARIKRGDFQLFSLSWVGIVDPDIYRWVLHSSMWPPKGANRGRYRNKKVDHWLDSASSSENREVRRELYRKVESKMLADMVYIPLWYEPVTAVFRDTLHGFAPRADGSLLPLKDVEMR